MRIVLLLLGIAALVGGLLFAGQGSGIISWPEGSFMVNRVEWISYGLLLAGLGLILIGFGARRPR